MLIEILLKLQQIDFVKDKYVFFGKFELKHIFNVFES